MFFLPQNILRHIYEYDSTFHQTYKKMIREFHDLTPFWRLTSDREKNNSLWYYNNNHYNMYVGAVEKLAHYWNYEYKNNKNLGEMYDKWVNNNCSPLKIDYKYSESLFDIEQKKALRQFFNNLNVYKLT